MRVFVAICILGLIGLGEPQEEAGKSCMKGDKGELMSMVMKEMISIMKLKMKSKFNLCYHIKAPKELLKIRTECLAEVTIEHIIDKLNSTKISSTEDIAKWYEDIAYCCMDRMMGKDFKESDLTVELMMEKMMWDKWSGNKDHLEEYKSNCVECTTKGFEGDDILPVKVMKTERCMIDRVKEFCQQNNKKSQFVDKMDCLISLMEESHCDEVEAYPETVMPECLEESLASFEEMREKRKQEMEAMMAMAKDDDMAKETEEMKDIRDVVSFFHEYFMHVVVKTFECASLKGGVLDKRTGNSNYERLAEIVGNMPGWESNPYARSQVVEGIKSCAVNTSMRGDYEVVEFERYMRMKDDYKTLMKCLKPKLMDACGSLKNNVARLLMPMINPEICQMFMDDLRPRSETTKLLSMVDKLSDDFYELVEMFKDDDDDEDMA